HVLAQLHHPGIEQVFEVGVHTDDDGERRPYFVMEYVRGEPLDSFAKRGTLDARAKFELVAELCDAVHHAHTRGVVHRDLKPANILVVESADTSKPVACKILDFGVARALDPALLPATPHTETGQLVGTVPFMSPEQVRGTRVDARTDVYALGLVAHWLLAGAMPYDVANRSVMEAARAILDDDPVALSTVDATLRGDAETIVSKALEKEPERRYATAADLCADIRRYLADRPIVARAPSTWYQLRKFARRNRALVAAGAALFVVLAAAAAGGSWLALRATRAETLARARLAESEREARRLEEVVGFLQSMITSADPQSDGSRDVTVIEAIDAAQRRLSDGALRDEPEIESQIRWTLGNAYRSLGRLDEAEAQLRAARATHLAIYGADDHRSIRLDYDLAWVLTDRGAFAPADSIYCDAIARAQAGGDDLLVVEGLTNRSSMLLYTGDYAHVDSLSRVALERSQTLEVNQDEIIAANLNNLGLARYHAGDNAAADSLLRESLPRMRAAHGPDHPMVIRTLSNLGAILKKMGDLAGAEEIFRAALASSRKLYGTEHAAVSKCTSDLAMVLLNAGDVGAAGELMREALDIDRRVAGPDHPKTARSENNLGRVLQTSGDYAGASAHYEESLAIYRRALGDDHPHVAAVLVNLAGLREAEGRWEEAESLYLAGADIQLERLGERHPTTVETLSRLVRLLESRGRVDLAARYRAMLGPSH
ncbi:MAG: serine/threonine-protein kinase, partial [Candidatus Latescibacteria bacterium]|nr:serine/threonine-protein kinase [Candidatus Latescibacterota bacterium]